MNYIKINNKGDKSYYKDLNLTVLHRENGPALECVNGWKEWYKDGVIHNDNGHAIECLDGTKAWYKNGQLHRTDGPAIQCLNGDREFWVEGKRHRLDGPAVDWNNHKEWWMKGRLTRQVSSSSLASETKNQHPLVQVS